MKSFLQLPHHQCLLFNLLSRKNSGLKVSISHLDMAGMAFPKASQPQELSALIQPILSTPHSKSLCARYHVTTGDTETRNMVPVSQKAGRSGTGGGGKGFEECL